MKTHLVFFICLGTVTGLSGVQADELVKPSSEGWKYLDKADKPAKDWNKIEFDDSKWKEGKAPLGYGDDDIKTKISFGDDEGNKIPFALFRGSVEIKDLKAIAGVAGYAIFDDGAIVYVNGKEVMRLNVPEGKIKHTDSAILAKGGELERMKHAFAIPSEMLKDGKNVIAIEVHQVNASSSDLAVDLKLDSLKDKEKFAEIKKEADASVALLKEQIKRSAEQQFDAGDVF